MKKCPNCGKMYSDLVKVCPDCKVPLPGADTRSSQPAYQQPSQPAYQQPSQPVYQQPTQPVYQQPAQPVYQQPTQPAYQQPAQTAGKPRENRMVGFIEAIRLFFTHYADFHSRSSRSEFWWSSIFMFLLAGIIGGFLPKVVGIWQLIVLVPTLAQLVRRLHDAGFSGWMAIVPMANFVIAGFVGSKGENRWGEGPNYID